jgi:hypothetical protein
MGLAAIGPNCSIPVDYAVEGETRTLIQIHSLRPLPPKIGFHQRRSADLLKTLPKLALVSQWGDSGHVTMYENTCRFVATAA